MRILLSTLLPFFLCTAAFSQGDSIRYEARYKLTHVRGEQAEDTVRQEQILFIADDYLLQKNYAVFSKYYSDYIAGLKALFQRDKIDVDAKEATKERGQNISYDGQHLYDLAGKKARYYRRMGQIYYFEVPLPGYDWTLTEERDSLAGYACRKATGTSSTGLYWEVWYAEEVPLPVGPQAITGLPGLVVHARNEQTDTTLELLELNKGATYFYRIQEPDSSPPVKLSPEKMAEYEQEFSKDRLAFLEAHPDPTTIRIVRPEKNK